VRAGSLAQPAGLELTAHMGVGRENSIIAEGWNKVAARTLTVLESLERVSRLRSFHHSRQYGPKAIAEYDRLRASSSLRATPRRVLPRSAEL